MTIDGVVAFKRAVAILLVIWVGKFVWVIDMMMERPSISGCTQICPYYQEALTKRGVPKNWEIS